jgi:prevent-host-death family protein
MTMVTKRSSSRRITAAEFKAKCLKLMDQVEATGDPIVITKRGVPVAELGPVRGTSGSLIGCLRGRIEIVGDIIGPIDGVTWEAMR